MRNVLLTIGLACAVNASATQNIPVIIKLHDIDKAPPLAFDKQMRRAQIVNYLQKNADASQRDLLIYLESVFAKRVKNLWIVNSIAAELDAATIADIAQL